MSEWLAQFFGCTVGAGPYAVSWSALGITALLLGLPGVLRLAAERQRRVTLMAMVSNAPGGTVIIQEKSPAGPAMQIWIGHGLLPERSLLPTLLPISTAATLYAPDSHRD